MRPREPRHAVLMQGRMRHDGARADVCVRNISSRGMLLQAAAPPARGSYVEIFLSGHTIVGRVVWTKDRRFGIQTQQRMNIDAIVRAAALNGCRPAPETAAPAIARRPSAPTKPTVADVERRAERSRWFAAAFEFACIVGCSAAAATITMGVVVETFASPMQTIGSHLQQGG